MQFTTALLSLATLASISPAAARPQGFTGTSKWWYWTVSNLTLTSTPAAPAYTYNFTIQQFSQSVKANCSGVAGAIKCSDSTYSIDASQGPFVITQKLYQQGAIAVLTGNTTLNVSCIASDGVSAEFTKTVCTSPQFKVDSYLNNTISP